MFCKKTFTITRFSIMLFLLISMSGCADYNQTYPNYSQNYQYNPNNYGSRNQQNTNSYDTSRGNSDCARRGNRLPSGLPDPSCLTIKPPARTENITAESGEFDNSSKASACRNAHIEVVNKLKAECARRGGKMTNVFSNNSGCSCTESVWTNRWTCSVVRAETCDIE